MSYLLSLYPDVVVIITCYKRSILDSAFRARYEGTFRFY